MYAAQLHARNPPGLMAEQRDDFPAAVHDVQNQHDVILLDAVADNVIVHGTPLSPRSRQSIIVPLDRVRHVQRTRCAYLVEVRRASQFMSHIRGWAFLVHVDIPFLRT
jgi:hypothetical protein